jgi:hypothetical protein
MRFEVGAAYAMGIALPLLEAMRRKTDFSNFHNYVDDFIIGALLLYAARSVTTGKRRGPVLLCVAWAILSSGLYSSFFWQLSRSQSHDVGGLANLTVVLIKGVLWAISLAGLFRSARWAMDRQVGD